MPRKSTHCPPIGKMYKTPAESQGVCPNAFFLPLVGWTHPRRESPSFRPRYCLPTGHRCMQCLERRRPARKNIHFRPRRRLHRAKTSIGQLKAVGGTHTLIGHSERRQYFCRNRRKSSTKESSTPPWPPASFLSFASVKFSPSVESGKHRPGSQRPRSPEPSAGINPPAASRSHRPSPMSPSGPSEPAKTATPRDRRRRTQNHPCLKSPKLLGADVAAAVRILYGGKRPSPTNATALIGQEEIDGALVGGASLKPDFLSPAIVKY